MNLKVRLSFMSFLEFAVWGCYLTCMGIYLSKIGMGGHIGSFFATQGIVSLFMPALMGIVADRWIPAQRLLGYCHLLAGTFMILAAWYGYQQGNQAEFIVLYGLYSTSVAFFMPTIALSNAVAFYALTTAGMDTVKQFPSIRVYGTIGFIAMMWLVDILDFEQNQNQFLMSGLISMLMFLYTFTLPKCPIVKEGEKKTFVEAFGLQAFTLFKQKKMAIFFIFTIFLGVSLQITNGFATPFIDHFKMVPEYADAFGVKYPVVLYSISQISETFCILLIPFFMKRYGIKIVMLIVDMAVLMVCWIIGYQHPEYITYDDLKIKSPYNTYLNRGLPPTPICNPGAVSLEAAFNPPETDYLYFLLKNKETGEHYFSKRFSEHNNARVLYLKKR